MEHGAFETWITNDAINVDRSILLDLLKTCVGCSDKAKAQLILKVEIEPPLDVSIVLRDFVRDMHRPQIVEATVEATVKVTVEAIVTALELKAGFGEIHPDDMWRVFSAENSNVAQLFLRWELDPDLKLEKRNSRTKGHIQQPAALLCAACMRSDTIVLEALIEKGADMRVFKEQASPCFLQNDPLRPELFEPHIRTPVSVAALLTPNLSCLKFLLDRKYVQPDVEGVNKWLLHYLCVPSELFPKRLSCFIGEIGIGTRFNNNSTPFNLSAVEPPPETRVPDNRRACLEMLLKHGLDPQLNLHVSLWLGSANAFVRGRNRQSRGHGAAIGIWGTHRLWTIWPRHGAHACLGLRPTE